MFRPDVDAEFSGGQTVLTARGRAHFGVARVTRMVVLGTTFSALVFTMVAAIRLENWAGSTARSMAETRLKADGDGHGTGDHRPAVRRRLPCRYLPDSCQFRKGFLTMKTRRQENNEALTRHMKVMGMYEGMTLSQRITTKIAKPRTPFSMNEDSSAVLPSEEKP